MIKYKKSLLISNILDPLTHSDEDLMNLYSQLSQDLKYGSLETRLIRNQELIDFYNEKFEDVELTYWVTGELQRKGLNLSAVNEDKRKEAVHYVKSMIKVAAFTHCHWLGIASGKIESTLDEGLKAFQLSVIELLEDIQNYDMAIMIEPLDQFAHKCNVVGTVDTTLTLLKNIPEKYLKNKKLAICLDTAHTALNKDDFEEAFKKLSPYISRVHFANAVLDETSHLYGDHHLPFCKEGILNIDFAKRIKSLMDQYLDGNVTVAVEIRETDRNHAWSLEKETYDFLEEVLR